MKRIFFAVTVCTLAIAATAATKANAKILEVGYTQDAIAGTCTVSSGIDCGGEGTGCVDAQGHPLFRLNASGTCFTTLAKQ